MKRGEKHNVHDFAISTKKRYAVVFYDLQMKKRAHGHFENGGKMRRITEIENRKL